MMYKILIVVMCAFTVFAMVVKHRDEPTNTKEVEVEFKQPLEEQQQQQQGWNAEVSKAFTSLRREIEQNKTLTASNYSILRSELDMTSQLVNNLVGDVGREIYETLVKKEHAKYLYLRDNKLKEYTNGN